VAMGFGQCGGGMSGQNWGGGGRVLGIGGC